QSSRLGTCRWQWSPCTACPMSGCGAESTNRTSCGDVAKDADARSNPSTHLPSAAGPKNRPCPGWRGRGRLPTPSGAQDAAPNDSDPARVEARFQGGMRMCGIVGYIGNQDAEPILVDGLRRLEYRGYDSSGLATLALGDDAPARGDTLHLR